MVMQHLLLENWRLSRLCSSSSQTGIELKYILGLNDTNGFVSIAPLTQITRHSINFNYISGSLYSLVNHIIGFLLRANLLALLSMLCLNWVGFEELICCRMLREVHLLTPCEHRHQHELAGTWTHLYFCLGFIISGSCFCTCLFWYFLIGCAYNILHFYFLFFYVKA